MHEDYVNLVGDIMYPKSTFHYVDSNPAEGKVSCVVVNYTTVEDRLFERFSTKEIFYIYYCVQFPLDKINTLGYLLNPLRKRSVLGTCLSA